MVTKEKRTRRDRPQKAKEQMQIARPQKEHRWLEKLVGDWRLEGRTEMGPGQPAEITEGEESVRSIDGLWYVAEGKGSLPGSDEEGRSVMTLGFDPRTGRYVGTWIGSMMTHMWIYDGQLDASGKTLTLEAEGPDMAGGDGLARYRDAIEIVSDDHRVLTSHVRQQDGSWRQFQEVHYRRS